MSPLVGVSQQLKEAHVQPGVLKRIRSRPGVSSVTKGDHAYLVLKEAIVSGLLEPGQRLPLERVASELDMSLIPVREALRRLEQEGLVTITPHIGARVSELPIHTLEEALLIRNHLEELAVVLAAEVLDSTACDAVEALLPGLDVAVTNEDAEEFGRLNREFHMLMYRSLPYKMLADLIDSLWRDASRARAVFARNPDRMRRSQEEHRRLVAAIRAKDGSAARSIMHAQKERALEALLRGKPTKVDVHRASELLDEEKRSS